jgi:hypothetical protein
MEKLKKEYERLRFQSEDKKVEGASEEEGEHVPSLGEQIDAMIAE